MSRCLPGDSVKRKAKLKRASKPSKPENRLQRKIKRHGYNPNPPPPPKEHQFKPGQSGNPGGRPRLLTEAYKEWLEEVDAEGITNARRVANAIGGAGAKGNVSAAGEIRKATEGERIRTWRDEVIDLLRDGKVTLDDVKQDLGEDIASELTLAAGIRRSEGGETHQTNTADG